MNKTIKITSTVYRSDINYNTVYTFHQNYFYKNIIYTYAK